MKCIINLNFRKIARTRGGHIRGFVNGYGRGRGRRRGYGVQDDRAELVEVANLLTRCQALPQKSPPSSVSVGNERDKMQKV